MTGNLKVGVNGASTLGFFGGTPSAQQGPLNPYNPTPSDPTDTNTLAASSDQNFSDIRVALEEIQLLLSAYSLTA